VDVCLAKKLLLTLWRGPYASQYADILWQIADKALDMGYHVDIFLYMDAVHGMKTLQEPKKFPNVGEHLKQLAKRGVNIVACSRCSTARGYVEGEANEKGVYPSSQCVEGIRIMSLYQLPELAKQNERLITLTG
jgi:tRNA 2-thiouridine synthesizing protein D